MTSASVALIFKVDVDGHLSLPNGSTVSVSTFSNLFADAPESPTYFELVNIDNGTMGYKPFFDQCLEEGLL